MFPVRARRRAGGVRLTRGGISPRNFESRTARGSVSAIYFAARRPEESASLSLAGSNTDKIFTQMPAERKTLWQRRAVQFGIILIIWTALGLIFTEQLYLSSRLAGNHLTWTYLASQQMIYPYLWAIATPIILWLSGRYPIEQPRWLRNLLLHALFSSICVVIVMGLFQIIWYVELGRPFSLKNTLWTIVFNSTESYGMYGLIVLLHHVFRYYTRYREGELRASQLEAQLSQAQLQALKMQLHPHFLFNTLHSISALAIKDHEAASKMITRLGDFLRATLENSGTQVVTLQEELEFLKCYLEIERVRFNDRLTTHLDIEPQALDVQVPNLILQPIVENAIRHGIAPRSSPGRIEIRAARANGTLRLQVRDNGPGLTDNPHRSQQFKEGLGLSNTRARLKQLYGDEHYFELANDPSGGLLVTMEIPSKVSPPITHPA